MRRLANVRSALLVVMDYAETRTEQVRVLARVLWARDQSTPTRLLLLARSPGEWWEQLRLEPETPLGAVLESTLMENSDSPAKQRDAYRAALRDLGVGLGQLQPDVEWLEVSTRLSMPEWLLSRRTSALDLQLNALTGLLQAGPRPVANADGLPAQQILLAHEQRYWQAAARHRDLRLHNETLRCAVTAASLCGGASRDEALDTARRVPLLRDQPQDVLLTVTTWLRELYPPDDGYWGSVEPDLLAECLIGLVLKAVPGLAVALLDAASDRQVHHAFTLLGRAAVEQPHLAGELATLLESNPTRLAPFAIQVATEAADADPLTTALERVAGELEFEQLVEIVEAFPARSASLAQLAAALAVRAADRLATVGGENSDTLRVALVHVYVNAAERLAEAGDPARGLAFAEAAVTSCRELAERSPEMFQPELAGAVGCLSNQLADAGRFQEALEAAQEAAAIRRFLAFVRSDGKRFLPSLGTSLNNLSARLADVGRRDDAVEMAGDAVALYRALADEEQTTYLPLLAGALNNQALGLSNIGRRQEGIAACEEATRYFRHLAGQNPDFHEYDLARSLRNLALLHKRAHQTTEALGPAEEAVERLRGLTVRDPHAFRRDLAHSLNDLAVILDDLPHLGRREEALRLLDEAVTLRRALAEENPLRDLGDLANSLTNLAEHLIPMNLEAAVGVAVEAIGHYRAMHPTGDEATLGEMARCLRLTSGCLAGVGQFEEAYVAASEAADILRVLTRDSSSQVNGRPAPLPDLCLALTELVSRLEEMGRGDEALDVRVEYATRLCELADAEPNRYRGHLLVTFVELAARFRQADRRLDAMAAVNMALSLIRDLGPEEIAGNWKVVQLATALAEGLATERGGAQG
jgi:tetratricopeptide (TPR) repeat protein